MTYQEMGFGKWLDEMIESHNLTQAELSRLTGVTRSTIYGVVRIGKKPGSGLCLAIAKTFRIPPEEVFRRAGILPPDGRTETVLDRVNFLLAQLPEEDQSDIMDYINLKITQKERKHNEPPGGIPL